MSQVTLPKNPILDEVTLGNWLWDAACKIRGEIDAAKYRDYILPLIFLKRLSDVFEDEVTRLISEYGESEIVEALIQEDHDLVRFYLPVEARWEMITKKKKDVGQYLTDIVKKLARENPKLIGAIDIVDFNATTSGERIISDNSLIVLIGVHSKYRLGINDVQADIIGRAYEYLLRKFAEGSGSSAGEFFTPPEVARLMGCVLDPEPGETVYDPCCGSGGLLIKCALRFREKYSDKSTAAPLKYFGQEWLALTSAMTKMNVFLHNMEAEIAIGDSMNNPKFLSGKGKLQHFDMVTSNPMWNQKFDQKIYRIDEFSRFSSGYPNNSSADWGWVQHMATEEAVKSDYNLSPSRYIAKAAVDDTIPLEDAVLLLKEAEEERAIADQKLWEVLAELGLGNEPVSPLISSPPPMAVAEKKQLYSKGMKKL